MSKDQLDLFAAEQRHSASTAPPPLPPAPSLPALLIVPFPMAARIGKVRDVAKKLVATKTARHCEHYRSQVTEALGVHLRSKRVPADLHAGEIASFWRTVDLEAARLVHGTRQRGPGGAA